MTDKSVQDNINAFLCYEAAEEKPNLDKLYNQLAKEQAKARKKVVAVTKKKDAIKKQVADLKVLEYELSVIQQSVKNLEREIEQFN